MAKPLPTDVDPESGETIDRIPGEGNSRVSLQDVIENTVAQGWRWHPYVPIHYTTLVTDNGGSDADPHADHSR
jgi:hypothetical protein